MAYLSYEEYAAISGVVSQDDYPAYDKAAENVIDIATRYTAANGLERLPEKIQMLFKRAVAAEIDYLNMTGLETAYTGMTVQGFRVGEVSVTNSSSASERKEISALSPLVLSILEQTGLMSRHVNVVEIPLRPLGVI